MPGPPSGTIETYSRTKEAANNEPIISIFTCDTAYLSDMLQAGEQAFVGEYDPALYYAYSATPPADYNITARPASAAAYSGNATLANDGADTGTITPIGAAAVVTITGKSVAGQEFTLTTFDPWGADDTLEFTSTIEGDYTITIDDFPDVQAVFVIPVRA
jgi:hypothetical protein